MNEKELKEAHAQREAAAKKEKLEYGAAMTNLVKLDIARQLVTEVNANMHKPELRLALDKILDTIDKIKV